jgi:hypothetical protein
VRRVRATSKPHLRWTRFRERGVFGGGFCPWCIADGTAASKFDATFTDIGSGVPPEISASVCDELAHRTPGVSMRGNKTTGYFTAAMPVHFSAESVATTLRRFPMRLTC